MVTRLAFALALVAVAVAGPTRPVDAAFDWCDNDPPVHVTLNGKPYVIQAVNGVPREDVSDRGGSDIRVSSVVAGGYGIVTIWVTVQPKSRERGVASQHYDFPTRLRLVHPSSKAQSDWTYGIVNQPMVQTIVIPLTK